MSYFFQALRYSGINTLVKTTKLSYISMSEELRNVKKKNYFSSGCDSITSFLYFILLSLLISFLP